MRIKVTEEQYALLNGHVSGESLINENKDLIDSLASLISKGFKETENEGTTSSEVFDHEGNEYTITFKCCPVGKDEEVQSNK